MWLNSLLFDRIYTPSDILIIKILNERFTLKIQELLNYSMMQSDRNSFRLNVVFMWIGSLLFCRIYTPSDILIIKNFLKREFIFKIQEILNYSVMQSDWNSFCLNVVFIECGIITFYSTEYTHQVISQ